MRVALLSYRSKTHCGGQGVYVRHLSRGLVELGHDVEVFSGQPYPEGLDPRVTPDQGAQPRPLPRAGPVPDPVAERDQDPHRPARAADDVDGRLSRAADVQPARRAGAGRAPRRLRRGARQPVPGHRPAEDRRAGAAGGGDGAPSDHPRPRARRGGGAVVAQAAGAPLVRLRRDAEGRRAPDPRTADRLVDLGRRHRRGLRRVARVNCMSCRSASTPSCSSPPSTRVRNRIIAIASADVPLKGVSHLLHAVARLRVERDLELQLVAKLEPNGPTEKLIAELGISDIVHSSSGLTDAELADLLASAEVACIPSLYEGFSLPAVEAMASGTPIVASRAGALPEVVGADGECARLVTPGRRRRADRGARRAARLAAGAAPARRERPPARARRVQLGIRCRTDGCGVRAGSCSGSATC